MDTTVTIDLSQVAKEVGLPPPQVEAVVALLDDGNTIPFVTRYRKDQTGGLDEEQIRQIEKQTEQLRALVERKKKILRAIESQGKLTPELADKIRSSRSVKFLDDLYLPYRAKKQTLARKARERGLEPLAQDILAGIVSADELEVRCQSHVDPEKGLQTVDNVMEGVRHLIAEQFSEEAGLRHTLRRIVWNRGQLASLQTESVPSQIEPSDTVTSPVASQEAPAKEGIPSVEADSQANSADPTSDSSQNEDDSVAATESPVASELQGIEAARDVPNVTAVREQEQEAAVDAEEVADHPTETTSASTATVAPIDSLVETKTDAANDSPPAETQPSGTTHPAPTMTATQKKDASNRQKKKDKKRQKMEAAFKDFFDFREPLKRMPPHRVLALNRGERAGLLRVKLETNQDELLSEAENQIISNEHVHADYLRTCLKDALSRLILPSLEREVRRELTEQAESHAIQVFARNLRNLLLQPPIAGRRVLAIDPGFRSGCKIAALDEFGTLLGHNLLHIVGKADRLKKSREKLVEVIKEHKITIIAIGNGTACRETETLVAEVITDEFADQEVEYTIVNEAGASVYSTSPLGREEMPDLDATQRSSVSIGRRLLDPLSELVKINPANIGVGLYQHDVKAKHLRSSLDAVVESCVNAVGVDINSASPALLSYVSGLNKLTARRIFDYRREHGPFKNREEIKQVPGVGESAFVQAAGFLKISGGDNPLDATWIHPESYEVADRVLTRLGSSIDDVAQRVQGPTQQITTTPAVPAVEPQPSQEQPSTSSSPDAQTSNLTAPESSSSSAPAAESSPPETSSSETAGEVSGETIPSAALPPLSDMVQELGIGELTLRDILNSLTRARRDPREDLPPPIFRRGIIKLDDLEPGMELSGTVLNVVDFGAFVDIGLHDSGLIHVSRLANRFISDPHEVVSVGDVVNIWVVEVDKERRRVSLTAIQPGTERPAAPKKPRRSEKGKSGKRPFRKQQGSSKSNKAGKHESKRLRQRKPAKPVVPLTKAMKEGREPMRTFGDLKQFYEKKTDDDDKPNGDKS
ncbi:MAG: helix-hairpin-helix domain-containing protein [Pirellulaceae bacterium]|nr:helix-hairpin-helix domain-containing protein [Pirellulaceae bacterium]